MDDRIHTGFIIGKGPAEPRNYGLKKAVGEYILFVDSDDYLPDGALMSLMEVTYKYHDAEVIRGNRKVLMSDGSEILSRVTEYCKAYEALVLSGENFLLKILKNDFIPTNTLIKRKLLTDNAVFFNEGIRVMEDVAFFIELCSIASECIYVSSPVYVYRLANPTSLTNSRKDKSKCLSMVKSADIIKKMRSKYGEDGCGHLESIGASQCLSALIWSGNLPAVDSRMVYDAVSDTMLRFPSSMTGLKNGHSGILASLFNLSPSLAFHVERTVNKIRHLK